MTLLAQTTIPKARPSRLRIVLNYVEEVRFLWRFKRNAPHFVVQEAAGDEAFICLMTLAHVAIPGCLSAPGRDVVRVLQPRQPRPESLRHLSEFLWRAHHGRGGGRYWPIPSDRHAAYPTATMVGVCAILRQQMHVYVLVCVLGGISGFPTVTKTIPHSAPHPIPPTVPPPDMPPPQTRLGEKVALPKDSGGAWSAFWSRLGGVPLELQ